MLFTLAQIRRYLSIASTTTVVLGLNSFIPTQAEETKTNFNRSPRQTEQNLDAESQKYYLLGQIWREENNSHIDERYKFETFETEDLPEEPIDWNNTKIEIDPNHNLDL